MTSKEALEQLTDILINTLKELQDEWNEEHAVLYKQIKQDLEKLEKIKSIIDDTNDKINETTDPSMPSFLKAMAYKKIIEVLENDK